MEVQEYRELLHKDIAIAAEANISNAADEFLTYVTDILSAGEEFDDFIPCEFEGYSRRNALMRIDGYSIDEMDGSWSIFIVDYRGPYEEDAIRAEDINSLFRRIRYFVEEATRRELFIDLEDSTEAYEFARRLYQEKGQVTKFKFYLLTDAYNRQRAKNMKDDEVAGKAVELHVWDVNRIFDVVNSKTQKESIDIVLSEHDCEGIPCVKAVEYHNIIADIEVPPKYDDDLDEEETTPENIITYSSYLAVVPGQVLNDLYLEYGSRLLEGNVRSFLSVRGKVNKSIQNTIKNYPEMFFAYNNGIAATATEVDTDLTEKGLVITRIKDLQIVNGGQTTASIANTLLTLKKGEIADISSLYVPMKLSVLDHEMSERIIPKISEYSNSQNKVDASDFFSNHPFHIRMEDYSRRTPAPAVHGNQYQQFWFYERTRGQYNQGKMKFKPKSMARQLRQYETKYPESQVIKLVDLAKYMEIYNANPSIVSKGKQAIVKTFSEDIKKQWDKSDIEFNPYYFKRVVALAIIFKAADEIVRQTDWYKAKRSYKANVVAYTMSVIFHQIRTNYKGNELDFMRIWNKQEIYPELAQQIRVLCTEVYEFITRDDRLRENVTEWCKREECWNRAKQERWSILPSFIKTLISQKEVAAENKEAKETRKINNEVDSLKYILSMGGTYWENMLEWGKSRGLFTEMEISILKRVINIEHTGWIPSAKQANIIISARERMIGEGMPLQF